MKIREHESKIVHSIWKKSAATTQRKREKKTPLSCDTKRSGIKWSEDWKEKIFGEILSNHFEMIECFSSFNNAGKAAFISASFYAPSGNVKAHIWKSVNTLMSVPLCCTLFIIINSIEWRNIMCDTLRCVNGIFVIVAFLFVPPMTHCSAKSCTYDV